MYRRILLIIAALVGSAVVFAPSGASARGLGGRGFGWGGAAIGLGLGLGLGAGLYRGGYGYGGGYPAYGYGGYGYRGGCWRRAVVHTAYGPRTRRVWVCG